MKFYHALQMDPGSLKRRIAACETGREKAWYWVAMAVRAVLTVLFAIAFISLLTTAFGAENTPMAVALFCILLGIRFVNFEYCIGDSLVTLAAAFAILTLAPSAAALVPPLLLIPLHLSAFFALIYMTTQRPELGHPAAGAGQRWPLQLCLHLSDWKSGGWGSPAPAGADGPGGLSDLRGHSFCQAPPPA